MRHYILGTAGHVDHGKTELVKALTGRDTDRLREEKERGISIELGFAPLKLDESTFLGIVDVPGHERFIKNMVAGAGGIDIAMLLVAADEGVMPQTEEHLEVLKSLNISMGVIVISKQDLVDAEMMNLVRGEIGDLVRGSFLKGAPVVETSAVTGEGLDALMTTLSNICSSIGQKESKGFFRMAIDRSFIRSGIGVVVTGSCISGSVRVGDSLELLPSEKKVRVRELQSFNAKRDQGEVGERLAIALQGVKPGEVERGDVLSSPGKLNISHKLDAVIRIADYRTFELKNHERVRVHLGAKEVMGRVVVLGDEKLCSGERGFVQLRLEEPVAADMGDLFVLRKYSPQRVLGGGKILDAIAPRHKRFDKSVLNYLSVLNKGGRKERILKRIADSGIKGIGKEDLDKNMVTELSNEGEVMELGGKLFHSGAVEQLATKVYTTVSKYNLEHPLLLGMDKEELKQKVGFKDSTALFNRVLEVLERFQPIEIRGNRVRAADLKVDVSKEIADELQSLEAIIEKAGVSFAHLGELKRVWNKKIDLNEALQSLKERGKIVKIGNDGYMHASSLEQCKGGLKDLFKEKKEISIADFKEKFNLTRKHAIPLLEFMDASRLTARIGDKRTAGSSLRAGNRDG